MDIPLFAVEYLAWHYTRAFRDIVSVWSNFVWFIMHFFSVPLLLRTLISPWRRMVDRAPRTDIESLFMGFTFNVFSRVLGFIVRSALMLAALGCVALLLVLLIVLLVAWVFFPLILLSSVTYGIYLIML